uniref:Anoctamin transmembrane domain-containing protein n=1 Tax=Globisporangium ultimum (strain ATCC 200006 / CBS 805.95 / DAOM BR144) TaxID=431595 RepID=K3X8X4_GLOUD
MPAGGDERPGLADVGAPSFGQRYRRTSVFANQNADAPQATALPRPSFAVPSGKDLNAAKNPTRARQLIMARIQRTGLHVKRLLSLDGKQTLLKVKAPQHVLERGAEQLKLRKLRKFDQIWMAFSCELRTTFADYNDREDAVRFLDSEKQSIVHWLLTTSSDDISNQEEGHGSGGAGLNEFCPLKSKYVVHMFPLHKQDLAALKRHWVTFWRASVPQNLNSNKDDSGGGSGGGSYCHPFARGALRQPIDDVAQYFGEHVAFYFAWMEMYTKWLIGPSVVGLILFCLQVTSKRIDHPVAPLYAMFMALWTSAFLITWTRRASTLAYKWGTLGYEDAETTRAEFYGDPAVSTQTHKRYPSWRRYLKYAVTLPLVLLSINVTIVLTYAAFSTRDRLEAKAVATQVAATQLAKDLLFHNVTSSASPLSGSTNETVAEATTTTQLDRLSSLGLLDWRFWVYLLVTPLLYGLLIPILDTVFTRRRSSKDAKTNQI